MKKTILMIAFLAVAAGIMFFHNVESGEFDKEECMFLSSLHYTARGMEYWYKKENGGLETLTGIPYGELTCGDCHVKSCDDCHKTEKNGKYHYSTAAARNPEICLNCHSREKLLMKIDKEAGQPDVHTAVDMNCMDCHSARDVHGDGIAYDSMKQPGAIETKCEDCHPSIEQTKSHTIHENKLDCNACHVRHVVSCTNCHFDVFLKTGKKLKIPEWGWMFLINHDDEVTSANMQTFVYDSDKTFLIFAPHMSHSIMKTGRDCEECHGTETVKQAMEGSISLTWRQNGGVENLKGVIPVVEDVKYKCVYQDRREEQWVPIQNPAEPLIQYPAYGKPLTERQLKSLSKPYKSSE